MRTMNNGKERWRVGIFVGSDFVPEGGGGGYVGGFNSKLCKSYSKVLLKSMNI